MDFIILVFNLQRNWIGSMEFCHSEGMMLATVETDAERDLLLAYLADAYDLGKYSYTI
jgi:hypothetical protein